jgi:hypothetical protein
MSSKKALLIGINYSNTPNELHGCINDVQNMRNALIDAYDYAMGNILTLRDDDATAMPTRENILQALGRLVQESSMLQEIWIHYSGHGSYVADVNGDEMSGRDSTICPCDFASRGMILDDELVAILNRMDPKCRVILLFDSCFSGSVCDLPWSFEFIGGNTFSRSLVDRVKMSHPNIYMMSGSKDTQTSADVYVQNKYQGAFTSAFLECLRACSHETSVLALYRSICMYMKQNGYSQKPLLSSTNILPMTAFTKKSLTSVANKTVVEKRWMQFT